MKNICGIKKIGIKKLLVLALLSAPLCFAALQPDGGRPAAEMEEKEGQESGIDILQQFFPPRVVAELVRDYLPFDWSSFFTHGQDSREIVTGRYDGKLPFVFAVSPDRRTIALGQGTTVSVYDLQNLKVMVIKIPQEEVPEEQVAENSDQEEPEEQEPTEFTLKAIALSNNGLLGYMITRTALYGTRGGSIFESTTLQTGAMDIKSAKKVYVFVKNDIVDVEDFALTFSPVGTLMAGWSSHHKDFVAIDVETGSEITPHQDPSISSAVMLSKYVYYSPYADFRIKQDDSLRYPHEKFIFEQKKDGVWVPYGTAIDFATVYFQNGELVSTAFLDPNKFSSLGTDRQLAISGNGEKVAARLTVQTNKQEHFVAVYNTQTGKLVASFRVGALFSGKTVQGIALSSSGNQLMYVETDGVAKAFAVKVHDLDFADMPPLEDVPEDAPDGGPAGE